LGIFPKEFSGVAENHFCSDTFRKLIEAEAGNHENRPYISNEGKLDL